MEVQIYRTNASSYQKTDFFYQEKERLESLPGVRYVKSLSEIEASKPFILITNTHTKPEEIPTQLLEKTILLLHPNSGYDNFNTDFIHSAKYPMVLGNEIRGPAVTEYILAAIFKELCTIPNHHHWAIDRSWDRPLLKHKKVFIYGFGVIGQALYQSLLPLAGEIKIFDPYYEGEQQNLSKVWSDDLMNSIDIFLTVASLNDLNKQFFNIDKIKRLSPEALIVNAARGELFNEQDLIVHLNKHPKTKAYLDVFTQEPFIPGYLHQLPNVNKTSHIAGVSKRLNERIIDFEYRVIKDFLQYYQNEQIEKFHSNYHNSLLINRINEGIII